MVSPMQQVQMPQVCGHVLFGSADDIWPCLKLHVLYAAEHHELRSAALQPVGSVVRQHAADRTVRPQWMAGTQLWRLWTDLGSAGLQVSFGDQVLFCLLLLLLFLHSIYLIS